MPQFSAAVCYSFTSSSIHRHVGWCRRSNVCTQFYAHTHTHTHTHTQARHLFYFEFGMLFCRFFSVIFSVIIFCVSLFSSRTFCFKSLCAYPRVKVVDSVSILRLLTHWSVLSLFKVSLPSPFFFSSPSVSPTLYLPHSLTLCLISADGFKRVCWEVY